MSGQVWMVRNALTAIKLCEFINENIDKGLNYRVEKHIDEFTGTLPMHKLWWKWMEETAQFMRNNGVKMPQYMDWQGKAHGVRPFKAEDAHDLFTSRWLGTDENGKRYSWKLRSANPDDVPAPKSKRLYAMEKHQCWALEKGLKLTNPEDSEFMKLQREQER